MTSKTTPKTVTKPRTTHQMNPPSKIRYPRILTGMTKEHSLSKTQAAEKPTKGASKPASKGKPKAKAGVGKGLVRPAPKAKARRAKLVVAKIDAWSVFKISFLLSVGLGIVTVVAGIFLWTTMDLTGIFDDINALLGTILGTEGGGTQIQELFTLGQVASMTTIIAVLNVVLITLAASLAALLYNVCASLVGGIGLTLTDD